MREPDRSIRRSVASPSIVVGWAKRRKGRSGQVFDLSDVFAFFSVFCSDTAAVNMIRTEGMCQLEIIYGSCCSGSNLQPGKNSRSPISADCASVRLTDPNASLVAEQGEMAMEIKATPRFRCAIVLAPLSSRWKSVNSWKERSI